ncbi:beta-class carbonic anhydrase [Geodermatophilus sp. SYSU D01105]
MTVIDELLAADAPLDVHRAPGPSEGEAHVVRNAGGVVTDDEIRSLATSRRLLGTREVVLAHHTDCGMLTFRDEDSRASIEQEVGTRPHWHSEAFPELEEDVQVQRQRILDSPFVPVEDSVRGFVSDVATGELSEVH